MKLRLNRSKTLLAVTLAGALVLSGCFGGAAAGRSIAAGWAGGIVTGGTLFVGSMQGKIIALDPADGAFRGEPVLLEAQLPSGGILGGCAPGGTTAVAIYGSPAAEGDLIYVGGYDGKVHAFVFDGSRFRQDPRWVYPRQGSVGAPIIGGVTASDGVVYFGTANGMVYALDGADGFRKWSRDIGNKIWSAPAVSGDTVFVSSFDKNLYALDADDGHEKWAFPTGGTLTMTPAVDDGVVYFGSFDRFFYAVEASTGRRLWRFPPDDEATEAADTPQSWYWTSPIVKDGIVYAPNLDGKVYGLNARTGAKTVEFDLGSPISSAPVLVGDTIVIATSTTNRAKRDGAVHALDTTSRQQRLVLKLGENIYAPLFTDGTTVYAHTMTDNLYAIDVASGSSRKFALSADGEE